MARIICICNQKGGVGKSATAINLASYLAAMSRSVLLIDTDPQANATSGLGIKTKREAENLYHTLLGQICIDNIIKKTKIFGCDIIPSCPDLAGTTVELIEADQREFRLKKSLESIKSQYDYILIDCPPSLDLLTINGLVAAKEVLIPVQCEYYALEGLSQLLNTIDLVKENLQENLQILGIVLTMFDRRNRLSHQVAKEVRRHFPGKVFEAVIPRSVSLAEAPSFGQSILQYAPESKGAKAYRLLAKEIIELEEKRKANFSI